MKKKRMPWTVFLFAFVLAIGVGCLSVSAESEGVTVDLGAVSDALPDELEDKLPDGFFSSDSEEAGEALGQMVSAEYLLDTVLSYLGVELGSALRLLAMLTGLLMISSVMGAVKCSFSSDALSDTFGFCSTAAIFSAILRLLLDQVRMVEQFFDRVGRLMEAMIPIMGTVWAMGGNVSTASAGTGTLSLFLVVAERLCAMSVMPVCAALGALALCAGLAPDLGVRGLGNAIKKIYTFSLGLVMTLLMASLSFQTTLSAAADSTSARVGKLLSGMAIPVVGGSVGETLRTLASGVQYMKGIVGVGGILLLLFLLLPVLLSLILSRAAFLLSGGVAELLGCDREGRLLSELSGIWGTLIAVVSMCSVMFILALWLFVRCAVAVG